MYWDFRLEVVPSCTDWGDGATDGGRLPPIMAKDFMDARALLQRPDAKGRATVELAEAIKGYRV